MESVWEYPRPPRLEPTGRHVRVFHAGQTIADTRRAMRVLETSHPPVYYVPPSDIAMEFLTPSLRGRSYCEFKGVASYWHLALPGQALARDVAWSYASPTPAFGGLREHLAFYASRVDQCWVDEELVIPQPGDFYGGWITSDLKGPFKGAPGTLGW